MNLIEERVNLLLTNKIISKQKSKFGKIFLRFKNIINIDKNILEQINLFPGENIKTKIYCFLYNIKDIPKCGVLECKNKVKFKTFKLGFTKCCSFKCGHIYITREYENPFKNKKHSEKSRKQMSMNHADFTGDKNPFRRSLKIPGKREAHRELCRKIWEKRDKEWRKNFGEKLSNRPPEKQTGIGNRYGKNHKSGHYVLIKNDEVNTFYFRSSYELDFLKFIENYSQIIQIFNDDITFRYKESINEKSHRAFIDFRIVFDNYRELIVEIKPKSMLNFKYEQLIAQTEYCLLNNLQYLIITETALYNKKLLISLLEGAKIGKFYIEEFINRRARNALEFAKTDYAEWEY